MSHIYVFDSISNYSWVKFRRQCWWAEVTEEYYFMFITYIIIGLRCFISSAHTPDSLFITCRTGGTTVKVGRLKAEMSWNSLGNRAKSCGLLKSGEAEASSVYPLPPGLTCHGIDNIGLTKIEWYSTRVRMFSRSGDKASPPIPVVTD